MCWFMSEYSTPFPVRRTPLLELGDFLLERVDASQRMHVSLVVGRGTGRCYERDR